MEVPEALRLALERQLAEREGSNKMEILWRDAENISKRYREQSGGGRLLTLDSEALAYAAARMPATYGAVYSALGYSLDLIYAGESRQNSTIPEERPLISMIDAGAGTGAASWAADSLLNLKSVTCLEREDAMRRIGEDMMRGGSQVLRDAVWVKCDLSDGGITQKADMVVASYVLNEMKDKEQADIVIMLWEAAERFLLLVEPGTPAGFLNLQKARRLLIERGAYIIAPCAHGIGNECPQPANDWCGFSCRIPRSRLHRMLKGGIVPYEDEKYCYLTASRIEYRCADMRVLRHPNIQKGNISFDICGKDGIKRIMLTKKDGDLYKEARKARAGDSISIRGVNI